MRSSVGGAINSHAARQITTASRISPARLAIPPTRMIAPTD
ncbi:hypothetical protein [Sphingomonas sp. GM_Shp_2]|nr:hypothetical protein [Sphingomonas sp. GM_Shp_2]